MHATKMHAAPSAAGQAGVRGAPGLGADRSWTRVAAARPLKPARVVRVGAFVQCHPGYGDQPKVANGASELLAEIFGEAGRHARAAVGSIGLPLNAPVEVEFLFEVR